MHKENSRSKSPELSVDGRTDTPASFNEIYREYTPRLQRLASRLVGEFAADDVVQDVWEQRLKNPTDISTNLDAYFTVAVRNRSFSILRRQKRQKEVSGIPQEMYPAALPVSGTLFKDDMSHRSAEENALSHLFIEKILTVIERLPKQQKEIMLLRIQDKGQKEIAELLGIKIGTVKRQTHRAQEMLRRQLDGLKLL